MRDGNKESAKELLSTFRALFAIAVSGFFFAITLTARNQIAISSKALFLIGGGSCILSLVLMIYLFFLMIPKLHREEEDIVEQNDIKAVSLISLFLFFIAYASLISAFVF